MKNDCSVEAAVVAGEIKTANEKAPKFSRCQERGGRLRHGVDHGTMGLESLSEEAARLPTRGLLRVFSIDHG